MKYKKSIKKAMATMITTSMIVSSMGMSFATNFEQLSDVDNHWAANQIKSLVNKGVVSGYSDGTFKPDNYITRAEFISLINKAFNLKLVYDVNYKDASSKDWFYEDLRKAKGYISGYEDNTIRPNNKITRQEVAVIMAKVLNKQYDNKAYVCDNFKDSNKIADWSKKSIGALVDSKNMSGYPDGTFGPEKYITRAEAVTVIYKKFKGSGFSSLSSSSSYSSKDDGKSKKREDVVIDDKGDRLKNKTIDGDLTISSDIGDGEVYLEDVTVKGTTYIYGGGENSIYIEDCDLGKVVVDKKDDKVRLVAQGSTTIDTVTLKSGAILEEDLSGSDKLTKTGFDDVYVEDNHKVTLKGDFDDVDIEVEDADLYLEEGEISKVYIKGDAEDAYIYVASNTKITTIDADERARVNGSGYVKKIEGSKSNSVNRSSSSSSSSSNRDYTAPTVSGVSSANVKDTSADVKLKSNEYGTVYYIVLPKGDTEPSKTQVKYGQDSKNTTVTLKGNKSVISGEEEVFNITGLTENTAYKVYVVVSDNAGNVSTVKIVDLTTMAKVDGIEHSAQLESARGEFDKKIDEQADVELGVTLNSATTVREVKVGGVSIGNGNYEFVGNKLIIKKEYMATKVVGEVELTVEFDKGTAQRYTIMVKDTTAEVIVDAQLESARGEFDKKIDEQADVEVGVTLNSATTVRDVKLGGVSIGNGNYEFVGNKLIIKKEYMATKVVGDVELTVEFDKGTAQRYTIMVKDTTAEVIVDAQLESARGEFDKKIDE
ncbi:S-layer homology domain-containing protein, partial [Tepidibacter sp. Z1-5]|uniref:S-layer homology domain-containing protein n=1 Tax=Tepidibacter sp. Z1-5 TaxID=3134138 RepID=UPI0030BDDC2A